MLAAWRTVMARGLSVRQTETLVARLKKDIGKKKPHTDSEETYFSNVAAELSRSFGTKVEIRRRGQKGKVEIEFYSNDDLDRLLQLLNRS